MDWSLLLLDLLALVVFAVLESRRNVRWAAVGAVLVAALELGYSLYAFGSIDAFAWAFAAFVLLFAGLSFYFSSPLFFRLKPAVLSLLSAGVFLVAQAAGKPLLLAAVERYAGLLPEQTRQLVEQAHFRHILGRYSLYLGLGFLLHAAAAAWAALRLGRWAWLAIAGGGVYLMAFLAALLALN